jgi:hypothetical protein
MAEATLTEPPSGYSRQRERDAEIVALPSVLPLVVEAVRACGTLYDWARAQVGARAFTGRGAAYAVRTVQGPLVVRHYRRGGMVARVLHDRYVRIGEARPLAELRASHEARQRGVSTPEVVAAVIYPAGPLYRADLATRLVPDAADLADTVLLRSTPGGGAKPDPRGTVGSATAADPGAVGGADMMAGHGHRMAAWRAAGELLRVAFDAGVVHADLNMRNILVQGRGTEPVAYLLDLDRAVVQDARVGDAARSGMLARLQRSRGKLEAMYGVQVTAGELQAFEEAVRG